jgi:hypothetical protein
LTKNKKYIIYQIITKKEDISMAFDPEIDVQNNFYKFNLKDGYLDVQVGRAKAGDKGEILKNIDSTVSSLAEIVKTVNSTPAEQADAAKTEYLKKQLVEIAEKLEKSAVASVADKEVDPHLSKIADMITALTNKGRGPLLSKRQAIPLKPQNEVISKANVGSVSVDPNVNKPKALDFEKMHYVPEINSGIFSVGENWASGTAKNIDTTIAHFKDSLKDFKKADEQAKADAVEFANRIIDSASVILGKDSQKFQEIKKDLEGSIQEIKQAPKYGKLTSKPSLLVPPRTSLKRMDTMGPAPSDPQNSQQAEGRDALKKKAF